MWVSKRRRVIQILAATGLLGPAAISGLIHNALAMGKVPIAPGLHKATGVVTVNTRAAQLGQLIGPGDSIETGPNSQALYIIGEDAFLQRENSTILFGQDSSKNFMRVMTGKILSVFGKGSRTISVSTATLGIRGTGCYIEDEGSGAQARTYFCLCYGTVELSPTAAPQEHEIYSTNHHEKPVYIHNNPGMRTMVVPAGVINHTDAELTLLEALVGRWPPFISALGKRSGGY